MRLRLASPAVLALVGGLLLGRTFPPLGWGPLAFVAYPLLLAAALRSRDHVTAFAWTWAAFALAYALAFPWPWRHPFPAPAAAGTFALVLMAALPAVAMSLARRVRNRLGDSAALLAAGCGVLGSEALLTHTAFGIPWSLAGHALADTPVFFGVAAYVGVEGLSAVILTAAALTIRAVGLSGDPPLTVRDRITRGGVPLLVVSLAALIPVPGDSGSRALLRPTQAPPGLSSTQPTQDRRPPQPGSPIRSIGVVQPGLDAETWALADTTRMRTLLALTESFLPLPDIVLWPESALRGPIRLPGTILVAGLSNPETGSNALMVDNAFLYEKKRLVPFVERVPGEGMAPVLGKLRLDPAPSVRGKVPAWTQIGGDRVGLAICFETLFADQFRPPTDARVILAATQDGWWDSPVAARQHLLFSRFRALETGIPLVLSSVNGFSAMIAPDGSLPWVSDWNEAAARIVHPPNPRPGRYPGDRISLPAAILLFLLLAMSRPSTERP